MGCHINICIWYPIVLFSSCLTCFPFSLFFFREMEKFTRLISHMVRNYTFTLVGIARMYKLPRLGGRRSRCKDGSHGYGGRNSSRVWWKGEERGCIQRNGGEERMKEKMREGEAYGRRVPRILGYTSYVA